MEEDKDGRMVGRPISEGGVAQEEGLAETVIDETEATPSTVEVLDLAGKNAFQASSTFADVGLTLGDQKEVSSDTIPEGEIVGQIPEAGTEVEAGSSVSVTVSSGPEEKATTVPDVEPEPQDRWKRKEALGAVVATFAGVAWIAFGILAIANLSSAVGALVGAVALIGTLGGLVGFHTRQATSYGRLGLAGFLAALVGIGSVLTLLVILNVSPEASDFLAVSVLLGWLGIPVGFVLLGVATL